MGLSGIGDLQRKARPGTGRLQGAKIVPGAKQSEDLAAERMPEQPVHLIQSPHKRLREGAQYVPAQDQFEIEFGSEIRVPDLLDGDVQVELQLDGDGEGLKQ